MKSNMTPQPTKKRHRATPAQLAVLESHFRFDPSPTPETREEMSRRIQMNEKSIHIWFQNRRAKEKFIRRQARQSPTTKDQTDVPATNRLPPPTNTDGSSPEYSSASPPSTSAAMTPPDAPFTTLPPAPMRVALTASTLDIGTWHRILTPSKDSCIANLVDKSIEYVIMEGNSRFKLAFPLSNIVAMVLDTTGGAMSGPRMSPYCSVLAFTLFKPPTCYMEVPSPVPSDVIIWSETNDFTEARQSSTVMVHALTGPLAQLASDTRLLLDMEPSLKTRFLERSGPAMSMPSSVPPQLHSFSSHHLPIVSPTGYPASSSPEAPLISPGPLPFNSFQSPNSTFSTVSPQFLSYYPTTTAVTLPGGQLYIPPPTLDSAGGSTAYRGALPTTYYPAPSIYPTPYPESFLSDGTGFRTQYNETSVTGPLLPYATLPTTVTYHPSGSEGIPSVGHIDTPGQAVEASPTNGSRVVT